MKILFIGNRINVLTTILNNNLEVVRIFALKDSYLSHYLDGEKLQYEVLDSKNALIDNIVKSDFDILVSNGCPYILPVSTLIKSHQKFINVHPSLLPDLRGINPVNGAILFNREAGATCHLMDDGVDTGKVLSRVSIGKLKRVRLDVAYQLCFLAEGEAFLKALENDFTPLKDRHIVKKPIYYSRKEDDMLICFNESDFQLIRKIKAFGNRTQCARFVFKAKIVKVIDANIVNNKYLNNKLYQYGEGQIIFSFPYGIVFKYHGKTIEFDFLDNNEKLFSNGDILIYE